MYAKCNTSKRIKTAKRSPEYQATIENEEATKILTGTSFIPLPAMTTPLSAPPKRKSWLRSTHGADVCLQATGRDCYRWSEHLTLSSQCSLCVCVRVCVCVCVSVAMMMYVRYRQVAEYLTTTNSVHPPRVNKASLIIGLLGAFGMTLVANFQVFQRI